ncbi:MAG: hypothetical protein CV090_06665 [Nitrospira sp. WS238]|nr:hypothetical protein [Nitrospira sp. WS238]
MSFSFYNHPKQKVSSALRTESISIGCEAWIDVSRFCTAEKVLSQPARIHHSPEDHLLLNTLTGLARKIIR